MQNRPLEPVYPIVWMDGIVFKVRESSKVLNKTVYLAVRMEGKLGRADGVLRVPGGDTTNYLYHQP